MAAAVEPRLRRTWPQRLIITFNVLLIVVCLVAASTLGYFYYRFGQLPRIDFAEGVLAVDEDPGEPQNWLLVGSDSRAFVSDQQQVDSFGTSEYVPGQRADTIILLRLDPRAEKAAMLSIPRDLYVPIAGTDRRRRINTAFEGGAEQLILTVKQVFNVPIHHYAQVDFAGFKGLVDAVGGVDVYFPSPARDRVTGLDVPTAGCIELNGDQALAYVRSRHYQYQDGGRWRTDPTGDIGRITRQQDFIRRAIRAAISKGLTNPARLDDLVGVAIDNVEIDGELSGRDMLRLGRRFRSLDPAAIEMASLPVVDKTVNGAAVLVLQEDEAEPILARFRGIDAGVAEVQPQEVRLRVLNGTGRGGEATETAAAYANAQFAVAGTGNAPPVQPTTTIRYGSGQGAKAQLVARYLAGPAELVEDTTIQGVDLVLTTGADFTGVLEAPKPPEAAPPLPAGEPPPPPDEPAPEEPLPVC